MRAQVAENISEDRARALIGADKAHERGIRGKGRKIAVIDTGYSEPTARELGDRIVTAESYVSGEDAKNTEDTHGDWCVQMIAYLCPEVSLVVLKGLSVSDGNGSYSGIISCVIRARELRCTDISMSLGGPASQIMDDAVNAADAAGLLVSVAAGNEQRGSTDYIADRTSPARASGVLTWAAAQSDLVIADFSNWGVSVDLSAPGKWVKAPNVDNYWSGTSMACPGGCADGALAGSSGKSKSEAKQALLANAKNTSESSYEEGQGFVNVSFLSATPQPTPSPMKADGWEVNGWYERQSATKLVYFPPDKPLGTGAWRVWNWYDLYNDRSVTYHPAST